MKDLSKKLKLVMKNPLWILVFLNNKGIVSISDEKFLKMKYYLVFHKKLNLDNPKTFNEKLQWLKLYDRKDIYTTMVDKASAKEYIAQLIGDKYIIPTLGVYDRFEDINFDVLPDKFVIKCTHDTGSVFIIKNKNEMDVNELRKAINKKLKKDFYIASREWPYKNIKPRIIIEKFIHDNKYEDLRDYKFYCFNGEAKTVYITSEREKNLKLTFFDREGNFLNVKQAGCDNNPNIELPSNFSKMIELAEVLSKGIPHLRVDFYEIDNEIYVGELTFCDGSGFGKFEPEEFDKKLGDMLDLSQVKKDEK